MVRKSPRSGTPPPTNAATSTPGSARTVPRMFCSSPRLRCCASAQFFAPTRGLTRTVRTSSGSIPRLMLATRAKLARNRPAPTRRTTASATSTVTSAPRSHWWPALGVFARETRITPAPPPVRENCNAGTALKIRPLKMAMATVVASTRRSMAMVAIRVRLRGIAARSASTPSHAPNAPSAAPPSARRRPSTSRARTRSQRDAPSADRITSSRLRALARASISVARFTHAMRRTNPTAARSMNIHVRTPRVR